MRKLVIISLCGIALLLAGYASYRGYLVWKQDRFVKMAKGFIEEGDTDNARLSLMKALQMNLNDLEATRLMADLANSTQSPQAMMWRNRVVELDPASVDDRMALAQMALMQGNLLIATNTLAGIQEDRRDTFAYQSLAGSIAAAQQRTADAEAHFVEAARLDPTNPLPRLNLAVLQLQKTNTQEIAQARVTLQELSENPTVSRQALNELIADAFRQENHEQAVALSARLIQQTNTTFRDTVTRLETLRRAKDPALSPTLAAAEQEAALDPAKLGSLAAWKTAGGGPAEALTWLETLPEATRTNLPAALIIAESQNALQSWSEVANALPQQDWAELDFLRYAHLARALRGQGDVAASRSAWEGALKAAGIDRVRLVTLLRLAARWNWSTEGEGILWTFVNRLPAERWAYDTLVQILYVEGRTRALMALFRQESQRTPTDLSVKNNLAMSALLLDAQGPTPVTLPLTPSRFISARNTTMRSK